MLSQGLFLSSRIRAFLATGMLCAVAITGPSAQVQAQEGVLLTMTAGTGEPLRLDLAAIDELPQTEFSTHTQWTEGKIRFSGPTLKDVLELADPELNAESVVHLIAANHYEVTLDMSLLEDDAPIVATRMNGKPYGTRQNGPLWVVFPYELDSRYQTESVYSASIWQLIEIRIEK